MIKRLLISIVCIITLQQNVMAQDGWPAIPGIDEGQFTIYDQRSFLTLMGAATISYGLAEWILKKDADENLNFYQVRAGMYGMEGGYTVYHQNFGLEKRLAPWFAIALEFNNQQWTSAENNGAGIGLNTHYRWYLFGKKRLSPFIEMGAGAFRGFSKFPSDGSNFTFHLTGNLGLEYSRKNQDRLRFTYGHLHQSNNDLLDANPGAIGNGFTISYARFWKRSKW